MYDLPPPPPFKSASVSWCFLEHLRDESDQLPEVLGGRRAVRQKLAGEVAIVERMTRKNWEYVCAFQCKVKTHVWTRKTALGWYTQDREMRIR